MTNNQLTRKRLEKIKSWRETYGAGSNVMLPAEEAEELALMALAAMDSEPVAWDYEWASCITCEGPQNFNRVIEREAPPEWAVEEGQARNIIPLYRHAQPAQTGVDDDVRNIIGLLETNEWAEHCTETVLGSRLEAEITRLVGSAQPAPVVPAEKTMPNPLSMYAVDAVAAIAEVKGWNACRATMLQAGNSPALSPSREHFISLCNEFWNWSEMDMICADDKGYELRLEWNGQSFTHPVTRGLWRMYQAAHAGIPIISDSYVMVPKEPTQAMCAAFNDSDYGRKSLRERYVAMTAAVPQPQNSPQNIPEIIPGWIPVSERMPDDDDFVYIWPRPDFGVDLHVGQYCECSPKGEGWYAQIYEQNYGVDWHPITVTHWMPLPAAPQEVKGEHQIRDEMDMGARITSHRFKV